LEPTLVLAPDALIRCRSGRLLVHTTTSSLPAFESDQPMLIGWLCHFAVTCSAGDALALLPAGDREEGKRLIDYLVRGGTLVAADTAAAKATDAEAAGQRTRNHLRTLARTLYETACDTLAFGPWIEQELASRSGIGLERRLAALLMGLDGLRAELAQSRDRHVQEQLRHLGVKEADRGLKLHIGAGEHRLEGWINIDVHPAQLALNVLRGLPFAPASARVVFLSHLLEHLYFPRDVRALLAELRRVLEPGGRLRIVVPDIEQCIDAYSSHDASFFASRRETWPWWPETRPRLQDFLAYAGAGPEPTYLFESHKYGYDFETLRKVLEESGFTGIEKSAYMGSSHADLRVDEASAVARAKYGDRYYSLFVEAERPE
jgi:predicted SAM-dependent methyltransferase